MLGLLTQPKPQRADETIITLCDRLSHSLLLEDRKAAILSLRGLAHDSRELVASAGLRGLLDTLIKDSHDPDTARTTLETLLILFSPETRRRRVRRYVSPLIRADKEADDFAANDISLWLADELLHNEEALSCVLTLASTKNDPFTAVYALQLVSAMTANRPVETKQAMLVSGGISTIVSALGSSQDMVRDEALLLLGALTVDHLDLQKLVVFEGGLDRVFEVLNDAGGVVFGGKLSEDCLSLLANLLQYNTSNQTLFTQSGYVKKWVELLAQIKDAEADGVTLSEQAMTNIVAALQIGQLLTVRDAERTTENQNILNSDGALRTVLEIAFGSSAVPAVRVAALVTIASLVDGNTRQQNDLLSIDVPYYDMTLRKVVMVEPAVVQVSQGLLNWALTLSSTHLFDLRAASLLCLSAALRDNPQAKATFLQEQIDIYAESTTSAHNVNLIEALAEYSDDNRLNPFRIWFAAAIIMHIFVDSPESKEQLQKVQVGDASLGMEVHGFIQAIAGEMQGALTAPDPTAALGYLQLLTVWFYDNPEAVSAFTAETSAIQALLAHQDLSPLVQSLAAIVLGTAYAFCSSQSSLPRKDFHQLLTKSLGRDHYLLLMRKFRSSTAFQNFDEADIFGAPRGANGIPTVYLDTTFVDLMRDSLGRISRAIDADPNIEPSARISFEMVEDLNVKLHEKTQTLLKTSNELSVVSEELEELKSITSELKEKLETSGKSESEATSKLKEAEAHIKTLTENLEQTRSEADQLKGTLETSQNDFNALKAQHSKVSEEIQSLRAGKAKAEDGINKMSRELFQLQNSKESLEKEAKKLQNENSKLTPKLKSSQQAEKDLKSKLQTLEKQGAEDSKSAKQLREVNDKLVLKLKETAERLKEYEEQEAAHSSELLSLRASVEDKDNELRSVQNRESHARKEVELAKGKIESLQKSEARVKELKTELKKVKAENEDLLRAKESQTAESEELKKVKAENEALRKAQESQNTDSEELKKVKAENEALRKAQESQNANSEELKKVKAENEALRKEQKSQNAESEELKDARNTISTLTAEKETLTSQVEAQKDLSDQVTRLKEQNASLENDKKSTKETDASKKELEEKQQALDELIVLLDDLTERKSSYKQRLRELNEDVSESDEDEDDDDEDDKQ